MVDGTERLGCSHDEQRDEFLGRPSLLELGYLRERLRDETVGGMLLLIAAAFALVWANSPWADSYFALVDQKVGPVSLHLDLPLGVWAADGLLAVFFFIVGLELKHELVLGSLSKVREAVVPAAAAIGGMLVPAGIFVVVNSVMAGGSLTGWGIPMATDIAFALAVLAVVGRRLPVALRAFLLTLAVVDDLGAITVIAIFYTDNISFAWLAAAGATFVAYALAMRFRITTPFLYVPLVLAGWYFTHESGVHATVAGVAFGFLTRVRPDPGEAEAPADRMTHLIGPISAGICVPLFAFFAAGVDFRSVGFLESISTPVAIGIIVGLVVGKPIGVLGGAWLTARFTRATLTPDLGWRDVGAIGVIAGIGFTVALLISELAYETERVAARVRQGRGPDGLRHRRSPGRCRDPRQEPALLRGVRARVRRRGRRRNPGRVRATGRPIAFRHLPDRRNAMPPQPKNQPSIKELVTKTVADAQRLAKAQAALLQNEMSATGGKVGKGAGLGIATAGIAIFAILFLLLTLAFALVALGLPIWAGMLIVGVILIIAGTITGLLAKKFLEEAKPPNLAIAEFEKTKAALSGKPADPVSAPIAAVADALPETPGT